MVLLLGADSYIGQAFARALRWRKDPFIPLSRSAFDYTRFEFLFDYVRKTKPGFLINAEDYNGMEDSGGEGAGRGALNGLVGNPGLLVSRSEAHASNPIKQSDRMEMLQSLVLLPQNIARICTMTNTPWGHVSSGSIYCGARVIEDGRMRLEADLGLPAACSLFAAHPERFRGFTELDEPNFSFKSGSCTFYSGIKALAEEGLRNDDAYVWRLGRLFNEQDDSRNFLSQLQDGLKPHDTIQSLSHLDECVGACLELWETRAAFGIYNVVNPGAVMTRDVVQAIQRVLRPPHRLQLLDYHHESNGDSEKSLSPACILDPAKLLKAGIKLRPVHEAIDRALARWQAQSASVLRTSA